MANVAYFSVEDDRDVVGNVGDGALQGDDTGRAPLQVEAEVGLVGCLLYTSPSPRDRTRSRMQSSA